MNDNKIDTYEHFSTPFWTMKIGSSIVIPGVHGRYPAHFGFCCDDDLANFHGRFEAVPIREVGLATSIEITRVK